MIFESSTETGRPCIVSITHGMAAESVSTTMMKIMSIFITTPFLSASYNA